MDHVGQLIQTLHTWSTGNAPNITQSDSTLKQQLVKMGMLFIDLGTMVELLILTTFEVDNKWFIPYNRNLTIRYDCHMNVERCAHTKAIKYLYKYIQKGHDRAKVVIESNVGGPDSRRRPLV